MRIAVVKETLHGERRVALVPDSAKKLVQAGRMRLIWMLFGDAKAVIGELVKELAGDAAR